MKIFKIKTWKYYLLQYLCLLLFSQNSFAHSYNISNGWKLFGSINHINLSIFDDSCVDIIWVYDELNAQWKIRTTNNKYSNLNFQPVEHLDKGVGFWVLGNNYCSIIVNDSNDKSFDFKTQEEVLFDLKSKTHELKYKRVILYLKKELVSTVVGDYYTYNQILSDAVFDKNGIYKSIHNIPTYINEIYILIPSLSIKDTIQIDFTKSKIELFID